MLYLPLDASRPERVQGVFISDEEVEELVRYWQTTPWASLDSILLHIAEEGTDGDSEDQRMAERDELLDKAIELAHSYSKLSTSLLQRRMRIGYPRAARLMDQLEEQGIVGPSDGSKSRDVIIG
jgi:S-DNA-T family DNA segregation ATPase FtsK/SpoIIIE